MKSKLPKTNGLTNINYSNINDFDTKKAWDSIKILLKKSTIPKHTYLYWDEKMRYTQVVKGWGWKKNRKINIDQEFIKASSSLKH